MWWGALKCHSSNVREDSWAASDLLFGLEAQKDREGRPIGERRAPSSSKIDVPMVLRECPYRDERHAAPMNVSALAQLTRHLDVVLDDLSAFRSLQAGRVGGWTELMEAIVDQLFGPGRHVLSNGAPDDVVPAELAVGHKLAAGYFGVLSGLLREEMCGQQREWSVGALLDYVRQSKALLGASEVCAGPPVMIEKVTRVLFSEGKGAGPAFDAARVPVARLLTRQIRMGIAWDLYDRAAEHSLLKLDGNSEHLTANNPFIGTKLAARQETLATCKEPPDLEAMERTLAELAKRGADQRTGATLASGVATHLATLLRQKAGAVDLAPRDADGVASLFASYLRAANSVISKQKELEQELRSELQYDTSPPLCLNSHLFPASRTARWMEALLGYRVERSEDGQLRLAQGGRASVSLAV